MDADGRCDPTYGIMVSFPAESAGDPPLEERVLADLELVQDFQTLSSYMLAIPHFHIGDNAFNKRTVYTSVFCPRLYL